VELIIVRHAIAEERDFVRWPDDRGRPLTPSGIRRFRRAAQTIGRLVGEVDALHTSPLERARQTAAILRREAGWPEPKELSALEPTMDPTDVLSFLSRGKPPARVALVGHEPHLHSLLSLLLGGAPEVVSFEMKKGGAAWLEFPSRVAAGRATLRALLPPRALLGERAGKR
jgi:phosphohistidine phosphatase